MLIGYDELKITIGGNSKADVAARLKKMGVKYLLRTDGAPITTIDAFNAAMRIQRRLPASVTDEQQSIEVH